MKDQNPRKYNITQCALYKCKTKRRLAELLCIDTKELLHLKEIIKYHSFKIDKKNSPDKRTITAPNKQIKRVQKRIFILLQRIARSEWLISGEKGKCYIDNGKTHLESKYVLTMDIREFYDHCTRETVYQFWIQKMKTSGDVAAILTDIVTYNSKIPTGCPTSQLIAFHAYEDMFLEIADLAKKYGCIFSLYVDDMTFSSGKPMHEKVIAREIDCILRKYGHKLKASKIRYFGPSDFKMITGTVISPNQQLKAPNSLQRKVFTSFSKLKQKLLNNTEAFSVEEEKELQALSGRIQASRNIEQGKFPEIKRILRASANVRRLKH